MRCTAGGGYAKLTADLIVSSVVNQIFLFGDIPGTTCTAASCMSLGPLYATTMRLLPVGTLDTNGMASRMIPSLLFPFHLALSPPTARTLRICILLQGSCALSLQPPGHDHSYHNHHRHCQSGNQASRLLDKVPENLLRCVLTADLCTLVALVGSQPTARL